MSKIFIHRKEDRNCNSTYDVDLIWNTDKIVHNGFVAIPLKGSVSFTKRCISERDAILKLQKSTDGNSWLDENTIGLPNTVNNNYNGTFTLSNANVSTTTKYRLELTNYKGEKHYSPIVTLNISVALTLEVKKDNNWVRENVTLTGCSVCNKVNSFEFRNTTDPSDFTGTVKTFATDCVNTTEITSILTPAAFNKSYKVYSQTSLPNGNIIKSNEITVSDNRNYFKINNVDFNILESQEYM